VIPEPIFTRAAYLALLEGIYRDIAPFDPEGVLQVEFLNARGAIARFDRDAIEIRVLDVQEHPAADLAIAKLVVVVLEALVAERFSSLGEQQAFSVEPLAELFHRVIKDGERAALDSVAYLRAFGHPGARITAGELWQWLASTLAHSDPSLSVILERGPLSRRILEALGPGFDRRRIVSVYRELADCAAAGQSFR
jgi:hypothetical protein